MKTIEYKGYRLEFEPIGPNQWITTALTRLGNSDTDHTLLASDSDEGLVEQFHKVVDMHIKKCHDLKDELLRLDDMIKYLEVIDSPHSKVREYLVERMLAVDFELSLLEQGENK